MYYNKNNKYIYENNAYIKIHTYTYIISSFPVISRLTQNSF